MRIETHGQQLEVTPALREYVDNKLQRIDRHFDQPIEIRVQLGLRKPDHHAEATLTVPGRTLHADATGENMYAAIDVLADIHASEEAWLAASTALESQTARLREIEANIELLREAHYDATDQVDAAQTVLADASATVG